MSSLGWFLLGVYITIAATTTLIMIEERGLFYGALAGLLWPIGVIMSLLGY